MKPENKLQEPKLLDEIMESEVSEVSDGLPTSVPHKSYYVYDPNTLIYIGEAVSQVQPPNSIEWKPMLREGCDAYFTGVGWAIGVKRESLSDEAIINAHRELFAAQLKQKVKALDDGTPDIEKSTWAMQLREAGAYIETGDATEAPFLKRLADTRGYDLKALAELVIEKAAVYNKSMAQYLGEYQRACDWAKPVLDYDLILHTSLVRT